MIVNDLERLKELKKQEVEIRTQIKHYSTYDILSIVEAIAKVMSIYEGVEYTWRRLKDGCTYKKEYTLSNYMIEPAETDDDIYATFKIKHLAHGKDKEVCELRPAYYTPYKKCYYLQDFFNFMYNKRVSYDIGADNKEMFNIIAESFLIENQQEINKRREEIEKEKQKRRNAKFQDKKDIEINVMQKKLKGIYYWR